MVRKELTEASFFTIDIYTKQRTLRKAYKKLCSQTKYRVCYLLTSVNFPKTSRTVVPDEMDSGKMDSFISPQPLVMEVLLEH